MKSTCFKIILKLFLKEQRVSEENYRRRELQKKGTTEVFSAKLIKVTDTMGKRKVENYGVT